MYKNSILVHFIVQLYKNSILVHMYCKMYKNRILVRMVKIYKNSVLDQAGGQE